MPHASCLMRADSYQLKRWRGKDGMEEPFRIMSHEVVPVDRQQLIYDHLRHKLAYSLLIKRNRVLLLLGIAVEQVLRERAVMGDDTIHPVTQIALDLAHEVRGAEAV